MRYLYAAIILLMLYPRDAKADRIHHPCDPDLSLGIGTGNFDGRTTGIEFNRQQQLVLRTELKVTPDQCEIVTTDKGPRLRLKRRWFGRVNVYLSGGSESSNLAYERSPSIKRDANGDIEYQTVGNCDPNAPDCEYRLDEMGEKIPKTKNAIRRADLHTNVDWSLGAGARMSIYDGDSFHLELFAEITGSPFYSEAHIDSLTARFYEFDLDVTEIGREHVDAKYRWWMYQIGLTFGMPKQPNRLGRRRLIPYAVVGFAGFRADIRAKLDPEFRDDLIRLGGDPEVIEEPRTITKHSPTASIGARYDPSKYFSLEATMMAGYTSKTAVHWLTASAIFRFDVF